MAELRGELLADLSAVEALEAEWDELAVASAKPYCAPGWMLSWWWAAAPVGARLRVATAREGSRLVGIAPCYGERTPLGLERLRLLAAPITNRVEPVAQPGREPEVAQTLAAVLDAARPRPALLALEGVAESSPWSAALARAWPGSGAAGLREQDTVAAPTLTLRGGSYDAWLATKSSNFRQEARRFRRRLEARGARYRRVGEPDEMVEVLPAFGRLHHARWQPRGGSQVMTPGVQQMLRRAAGRLGPAGRLQMWTIEVGSEPISAHLFVSAGTELSYWLGGFDPDWAVHKPGLQALLAAAADAFDSGYRRLDLGGGAQDYKYRLADGEETLVWQTLAPAGIRSAAARMQLAPEDLRRRISRRLSPERRARLKRLWRARGRRPGHGSGSTSTRPAGRAPAGERRIPTAGER